MTDQVVTIEGSPTPCSELPRGVQKTVLYTERVQRLIKKGYFVLKSGPTDVGTPAVFNSGPGVTLSTATPSGQYVAPHPGEAIIPPPAPPNPFQDPVEPAPLGPPPTVPQHPNETAQHTPAAEEPVQTAEQPTG